MPKRLFLAMAAFASVAHAAAQAPACRAVTIDSAQLLRDDARLSADSMRGRQVGSPENARARDFIAARFDALGLTRTAQGRVLRFVARARGQSLSGNNVAGIIMGTKYPDEFIVVTAHYDHIGYVGHGQCRARDGDSICNGADDNASGTAGILALAEYFSRHPAEHSLLFVAFDAEEEGDVGSTAFVKTSPVALGSMLLDVNLDMVGRNVKNQLFIAGPGKYPALAPVATATIGCTSAITLTIGHDGAPGAGEDWTSQSDPGAFHRQGIPFAYFGEEDHPDYHQPGDQVEHLMPGFYTAAVRAAGEFIRQFDAAPVARK